MNHRIEKLMTDEPSLKKRYFFKLMTNFVGLGIGLITQSIVPRTLGPSSYGNFSFLTSFYGQVIGFLNLNSSTAFYTKLSQRQHDKGLISFYFYLTLLVGILMGVLTVAIYLLSIDHLVWPEQKTLFVVLAAIWAFLQVYSVTLVQISDAYGLTTKSELVNMIQKIVGLVTIVFLFWGDILTLLSYFIFQLLMFLIIITSLYLLIQKYKASLLSRWRLNESQFRLYIKEFASFCLPLIVFFFFAIPAQMLDRWFLQKFSGSTQQGFYALAYQTGSICMLFVSAMIPLIMREFSISFVNKDVESMRQLFSKYSKMLFAIAAFFGCFLAAEAKNVMLIFGGQAYTGAILPITIMCFYPIHQTYGQMNASFFFATARTKTFSNIGLSLVFISLPLTFFLLGPKEYGALEAGATGLSVKMVFMGLLSTNILLWYNSKYLELSFRNFLIHQVFVISVFVLVAWGCSHMVSLLFVTSHFLTQFLISGIIYTLIIMSLVWFFPRIVASKQSEISALLIQVKNKLTK